MRKSSAALIILVLVGITAVTGSAFSAHPAKQIAGDTPKIGQSEDRMNKPLNQGEEHINKSIDAVKSRMSQPKYTIWSIVSG